MCADFDHFVMCHRGGDEPEPVHMHREVHGCFIPSDRTYEDYTGSDIWIHFVRKRGSNFASGFGNGGGNCGNDMVW